MSEIKLQTDSFFFGQPITLACDLRCDKAWGRGIRPDVLLSTSEDDYAYLADNELDTSPADPGVYEGGEAKPMPPVIQHNKWCARACERCAMVDRGRLITLPDFSRRKPNIALRSLDGLLDFTVYWTKADDEGEFYVAALSREEAQRIAQWNVDLYLKTNGAEIKLINGLLLPVHGNVIDCAEE